MIIWSFLYIIYYAFRIFWKVMNEANGNEKDEARTGGSR